MKKKVKQSCGIKGGGGVGGERARRRKLRGLRPKESVQVTEKKNKAIVEVKKRKWGELISRRKKSNHEKRMIGRKRKRQR